MAKQKEKKPVLSIIIPAYNEKNTVLEILNRIVEIKLPEVDKEIIIVESNSTDGTREAVTEFAAKHREIKLISEDRPRGKSFAVCNGLNFVTGDIIMIQDADSEYDINDYPKVIAPIINRQADFVLGSRYLGVSGRKKWQVRQFGSEEKFYAQILNIGGVVNHLIFNVLYGTKITDPTTMYKVFRKELLDKVEFVERKYFSLDWEIVCKFVRLGAMPLEVPIQFKGRGKKQGKKIRILRDGYHALRVIFKYRFMPLSRILKKKK